MAKPKKPVKKNHFSPEREQFHLKIVTSDTCRICTQQCDRGIRYMEKMAKPGAIGFGVPCILTKYKKGK